MNTIKLDTWLNLAGSIAVFAGLVLLAIEVRDNTATVRQQERGAKLELEHELILAMAGDDVGASYVKMLYTPSEMTPEQVWDVVAILTIRMTNLARTYHAFQAGLVTEDDLLLELHIVPAFLATPAGRLFWEEMKPDFARVPDLVRRVDAAIAESTLVPDDEWLNHLHSRLQAL